MTSDSQLPILAFVWRVTDITSSVVEMARHTGSRVIFDLTAQDPVLAGRALLQADAGGDAVDLKISHTALMEGWLESFLEELGVNRIWVELHPRILEIDLHILLDRIAALSSRFTVIPVAGDCELIARILNECPVSAIALKGNEASGFVGSETTFTLYSSIREKVRERSEPVQLFVWGGVATPEAAAAFLAAGSSGIIFESLHWLTDLPALDDELRQRISRLQPDHTDLVGLNLDVPCRLFNKGNSVAVKELKEFAGSMCGPEISELQRRYFAGNIQNDAVPALESKFGREQLIPLGVEAAFAASFVKRFGFSTDEAVDGFMTAVQTCCKAAADKERAFVKSTVAQEMGTSYPFVQGAMSWITDVPEFARKVADAGALPTLALGMMDTDTLEGKLGALPELMGDRPYAVNVITLPENPNRDAQLAWIRKNKPRFAVIAAGEPSHAAELLQDGIEVIYIAPNEKLLKLAFEAGVRYVICEGQEAGGHVGQHSTLTLAQMVNDLKNHEPSLFEGRRLILAGGVFNRETAFIAAMLGADAIQMGTAYLTCREIVETGALTKVYQRMILESDLAGTVVTGEGTGLRVRSLKTPSIEAVCSLEREFAAGAEDEASFRRKIEALTAGSLLIAARATQKPGGDPLDENACIEQGQFMSGACSGPLKEVVSLDEYHRKLAEGPLAEGLPFTGPIRVTSERPVVAVAKMVAVAGTARPRTVADSNGIERIAITGMSIANSLGNSPEEVWQAALQMKSGIIPVPASKWNHDLFYHPRPRMPEKTYCKVGAFLNLEVSRKEVGIPPQDFRTMTDSTKMTMWLAGKAIQESGILDSDIPRERIAVMISQNSGEAAATLQDVIIRGSLNKIVSAVKRVVPLDSESERAVEEEIKSGRIAIDDTTLLGRLNCSAGGFICNKYGFMGPSWSVSAACATALVALYSAVQMIRNGIIDAAVVGGAEEPLTPMHFLEFSALGALAGLSGIERVPAETSRPFDADRDGMVLGEGGGFIVIERESIARKRGAGIHAFVTSMGASNNHLGMVESSRITQEIAINASFRDTSYGPEGVDMVECHATSTQQGDIEEVLALKQFFDSSKPVVLTSFKSQIGHTLGSSGINSLIRGVMAMKAGIFAPTLNYRTPDPGIGLEKSGLSIYPEPVDWALRNGKPRRLQVNAFGFGGSNYVVQLEQSVEDKDTVLIQSKEPDKSKLEPGKDIQTPAGISFFRTEVGGKLYRLAVVADKEHDALTLIERAEPFANGGPIAPKRLKALARQGIHLGPEKASTPPLAFVFPGQGSHYAGMSRELYETFPVIHEWMDRASEVADFDLLQLLFHDREEDLQKTRWQQPALFTMEFAMVQYMMSLGIRPAALAGHSLGELTALCLSGVYSFEDGFRIVNKRAVCMDKACELNVDPGVMMAVDAPLEFLEQEIAKIEGVYITNINSPHQVVLGGNTEKVQALGEELKQAGYRRTLLRVSMAFHSPIMRCIHDELDEFIAGIQFHPPKIPVVSNTTMQPFPEDTQEIKRIVMAHLESPVHWMQNVRTLWDDYNVRLFVEVGPRDILSNMIQDTIEEAGCIQTCLPSAEALMYRTALAQLYVAGHLQTDHKPAFVSLSAVKSAGPSKPTARPTQASALKVASPVESIIQREINAFVVESFGRFLKPAILQAIRREHDPSFPEESLDRLLFDGVTGQVQSGVVTAVPHLEAPTPAAAVSHSVSVPTAQVTAPAAAPAEAGDITETVIRIIMDATGYERDEIEPDMDLREDLSIRSSRLPVIMDAVEAQFAIKIELEEFMDVRTIRDISTRIAALVEKGSRKEAAAIASLAKPEEVTQPVLDAVAERSNIKRMVFREVPAPSGTIQPVELKPGESVVIISAEGGTGLRKQIGDVFRRDYGATIVPLSFMGGQVAPGDGGGDLLTDEGSAQVAHMLGEIESLAGIVFVLDEVLEEKAGDMDEISRILKGFFALLKTFLDSSSKKFAFLVHKGDRSPGWGRLLAQGVLGMFLSASHEFGSVQFRTVRIDADTSLRDSLRAALDRSRKVLETIFHDGTVLTVGGVVSQATFEQQKTMQLDREDVVVFSGGAYGITPFLARSLVPFACKMIFLGRTVIDPDLDFEQVLGEPINSEEAARQLIGVQRPGGPGVEAEVARAVEILRNVKNLRSAGIEASYLTCDVTDPNRTAEAVQKIEREYGRISGVVHAAGFLKDNFIKQMTPDDFVAVVNVKFLGAWNLFHAVDKSNLKFFACLSSAAAIQGNPGQVNYAAGNRIMSTLMSNLARTHEAIRFKAFMLAPIEGAGMAEDQEIRSLMKRMNADYIHVDELAALFCRELFIAPQDDVWVMFMRSLPDLSAVSLDTSVPSSRPGLLDAASLSFKQDDFPMIESVDRIDLQQGELEATRSFSQDKDLWIIDHKPFKFMKHPLVSAIMALETFMEASRILYPHLRVLGVRQVQFLDIIECPIGVERTAEILCHRIRSEDSEVLCELSLATREISPTGRTTDRMSSNYKAQVILGNGDYEHFPSGSLGPDKPDSRPMDHAEVLEWYRSRTDLNGRYRVISDLEGTSQEAIRGRMIYGEREDFAEPKKTRYQYSPYLLEALMQMVNFYIVMRDPHEQRSMIPYGIGEMLFARKCKDGEPITLEARMKHQTEEGITWEASGLDENGRTVMCTDDLTMRWFSK